MLWVLLFDGVLEYISHRREWAMAILHVEDIIPVVEFLKIIQSYTIIILIKTYFQSINFYVT